MARVLNCESVYQRYRDILERGSAAFDKLLWNGECKHSAIYCELTVIFHFC